MVEISIYTDIFYLKKSLKIIGQKLTINQSELM